ncbi:hypothetical protein [Allobaculum mucilyticum]|uniref:hypothetical protein n=1 Tax=Allobaculum mucilyticum TaxID=2834459 RepID=UPI001E621472|nr:hypothetical protein [Allobaculum mucilyticum]UNT95541.1 hypothetical protein KWG62_09440 [Allobaculum mucilyticum]
MKLSELKAYHAYYVMTVLFFASCFFFKDMVFFPLGCCMLCLGWVKQLKETGRLKTAKDATAEQSTVSDQADA